MRIPVTIVIVMLTGCSVSTPSIVQPSDSLGTAVQQLVTKADADDQKYFKAFLDESYKNQSAKLVTMIKRGEINLNYKQRFTKRLDGTGRLDYHYLEKGCHFQIDLRQKDGAWEVTRIWFCR